MRKAIIITLVLAVLALFAVGCQQPAAGRGFYWEPPESTKIDYGFTAPTIDYGIAAPAYPGPMPGAEFNIGTHTSELGTFTWDGNDGSWTPIGAPTRPIPPPASEGTIGVTHTSAKGTFTWDGDSGSWTPISTEPEGVMPPTEGTIGWTEVTGISTELPDGTIVPTVPLGAEIGYRVVVRVVNKDKTVTYAG